VTIISGHRDTHFEFLENVSVNQHFTVQKPSGERVQDVEIVNSSDTVITAPEHGHQLVLVTCYPFGEVSSNTDFRLLVIVEPITGTNDSNSKSFQLSRR
jgi:sortase A